MTNILLNNRYQILETLGRGGFGETFLAIDTHMPSARKCVIKQLKPVVQSPQIPLWLKERFQREAAILEELGENHPQIPRLYAYFAEGGDFYLVQEWIEGVTLTQKQQQQGNLSETEVREILVKLLPVLDYLHSHSLVHRDVKPDNIILRKKDNQPVLIDFGVIKEAMSTMMTADGKTAYSIVLGTPGYMPSEQAAGRPIYSSDLYSLGLTAIFLLTGKTPQQLDVDINTGEILWRQGIPNLPSSLATVLDRSIRFHPRDRFSSAKEMLAALQLGDCLTTAATIAITPEIKKSTNSQTQPFSGGTSVITTGSGEIETENNWLKIGLLSLLFLGVIVGGFALGFHLFFPQGRSIFSPSDNSTPAPQTFPTPESPSPEVSPSPTPELPRRRRKFYPTPTPETSPTPTPETSPSPTPETSPSPTPEISPSPIPETSPSPTPETSPSPIPEISPSSHPKTSPSIVPTPQPTPLEGISQPNATTSPSPINGNN